MELSRRQFTTGLLAGTATVGLEGCLATNPATGRTSFTGMYSIKDDIRIGRDETPKLTEQFGGEYSDLTMKQYVSDVGLKLARTTEMKGLPYTFTVLNSPIVNAFALPGGFVFVSRGLLALAGNEAEMAAVLAHELGHVNARHTAERLSKGMLAQVGATVLAVATGSRAVAELASFGAQAYIKGFSRDQEFEADMLGVRYMSRAGYDPEASVAFLSSLREYSMLEARMMGLPPGNVDEFNIMSTHPRTEERVRKAMAAAKTARPKTPRIGRDVYLALLNGLMYGDDPKEGIIRGRRFVHPVFRFEFTVPEGFRLINGRKRVVAKHPKGAAIVFDMGKVKSNRTLTGYLQREWAGGTTLKDVGPLDVNGLDAATGRARVGNVDVRLVAFRGDDASVFRLMFQTPVRQTSSLNTDLRHTTYSFRRLSRAEADKVQAMRLIVITARQGDTVKGLARTLPFGKHNEEAFRILNDFHKRQAITPGEKLKVIAI